MIKMKSHVKLKEGDTIKIKGKDNAIILYVVIRVCICIIL